MLNNTTVYNTMGKGVIQFYDTVVSGYRSFEGKDCGFGYTGAVGYAANGNFMSGVFMTPLNANNKTVVTDLILSTSVSNSFIFSDDASNYYAKFFLPAEGSLQLTLRQSIKMNPSTRLKVTSSATGDASCSAFYFFDN